jgi:hypothetical protein
MSIPGVQENLSGPHLQLAAFCEKVLIEANNVISLIRVLDRFNVNGPTPEMAPATLTFFLVVSFKAGFVRGKHTIRIVPLSPSHVDLPAIEMPQFFEGDDDRGVMIAAQMNFLVKDEGLYWFRVYFENALVTQIPLRVVYQQVGSGGPVAG